MVEEYERTGFFTLEDLRDAIPPEELMRTKQLAMIECPQEIPCDACRQACLYEAVIKRTIIEPPKVDFEKCTGCTLCARVCPGLAIFMVHITRDGRGRLIIPFEFLPLPKAGETVQVLDREGKPLGDAKVLRVLDPEKNEKTAMITLEVGKDLVLKARGIRVL